jgi:hypothetical protein
LNSGHERPNSARFRWPSPGRTTVEPWYCALCAIGSKAKRPASGTSTISRSSGVGAAVSLLTVVGMSIRGDAGGVDARAYWAAARIWLAGGDPYHPLSGLLPYVYAPWQFATICAFCAYLEQVGANYLQGLLPGSPGQCGRDRRTPTSRTEAPQRPAGSLDTAEQSSDGLDFGSPSDYIDRPRTQQHF